MVILKKTTQQELSAKKIEEWNKYCKVIQWGRENPVKFIEEVFDIKLIDYQSWALMNTWCKQFVIWLGSRGMGKDALSVIYYMAKMLLIPNYRVYISALSAGQSAESFKKLEDIALKRIPHFKSANDVFSAEIEKNGQNESGFVHDPKGHKFRLFNNSEMITLSSNLETARGKRGSVWQNECGWQSAENINVIAKFTTTDSDFSTSTNKNQLISPPQMPLQLLYTTSASDVTFKIYELYKQFAMKMIEGDNNYFVCDIDANDIVNFSTIDGEPIKSHLSEELIKQSIEEDADLADRELFNKFRKGGGDKAVISMENLLHNSYVRKPELYNITGKDKFIFTFDPARNYDGSVLSIFKVIKDKQIGYKLECVNVISMVDRLSRNKTPLPMPQQLKIIEQALLDYNGVNVPEYENILGFYIDAGSGGGGISAVADQLMEDWTDKNGNSHRGLIDPEHKQYETARKSHPNAYPCVRLIDPQTGKVIAYEALSELFKLNLISFTQWDRKDHLLIGEGDDLSEYKIYELSSEEKEALAQIELMKTQVSYMIREENFKTGKVSFELMKSKQNTMHDDHAYCLCLAGLALKNLRRNELVKKKKNEIKEVNIFQIRTPKLK